MSAIIPQEERKTKEKKYSHQYDPQIKRHNITISLCVKVDKAH
jgi:hypothetical protein